MSAKKLVARHPLLGTSTRILTLTIIDLCDKENCTTVCITIVGNNQWWICNWFTLERGGRGVEPAGPVHNEEVEGGQLTEHLGSKVGGEAIGTTGTLLIHYHTLRKNWLGDKPLNPALLRWCNKFKTQANVRIKITELYSVYLPANSILHAVAFDFRKIYLRYCSSHTLHCISISWTLINMRLSSEMFWRQPNYTTTELHYSSAIELATE